MLGSLWSVLNPLAIIIVYTIIFSQVMKSKLPGIDDSFGYSIYLCAGLLPWQYFAETMQRSQSVFIEQGSLLKKVSFPRASLPTYIVLSSTINFLIVFGLFLIFVVIKGDIPQWEWLAIIPLLLLQQALAIGVGTFLGVMNVFFRDISHILGIILQFWFWLTPVVYPIQAIPKELGWMFDFNIMYPVIKGYQAIFLYHNWPEWSSLITTLLVTILLLILGYFSFKKLEKEMVDEL